MSHSVLYATSFIPLLYPVFFPVIILVWSLLISRLVSSRLLLPSDLVCSGYLYCPFQPSLIMQLSENSIASKCSVAFLCL